MRNYRLTLSYDGTNFKGWQFQPGKRTVQEELENGIATITKSRVLCNSSGRTDAGVHALAQVVNFYCNSRMDGLAMMRALNTLLPQDIRIIDAIITHQAFDASKDALRKRYRYVICDGAVLSPFMRNYVTQVKFPLDVSKMNQAANLLLGRHDFHSFESDWPNRMSSIRSIYYIHVNRVHEYLWLEVEANGFLYNMVRAIAGTLINIGRGYWPPTKMKEILQAEDRTRAGPTAPPQGLYLVHVTYSNADNDPERFFALSKL